MTKIDDNYKIISLLDITTTCTICMYIKNSECSVPIFMKKRNRLCPMAWNAVGPLILKEKVCVIITHTFSFNKTERITL